MSPFAHGAAAAVLTCLCLLAGARAHRLAGAGRTVRRLGEVASPPERDRWSVPRRLAVPAILAVRIEDAAPGLDPVLAVVVWSGAAVAALVGASLLGGLALVVCSVVLVLAVPALVLAWRRGTADRMLEAALPDALEATARALRSGAGSHQALAEAAASVTGPLAGELRAVTIELAGGTSFEGALTALEQRRPVPGIRLAVAALLVGADAGGAHARALDGVAASVRARLSVSREVQALSSQTRLSAVVIACAPLGFAAVSAGADATSAEFLFQTTAGVACLAVGLLLDGVGAWWMHRISQVET